MWILAQGPGLGEELLKVKEGWGPGRDLRAEADWSALNTAFNTTVSSRKPKSHYSLTPKQLQSLARPALRIFLFHFLLVLPAGFLVITN